MIGERYGRLEVLAYAGGDGRKTWWKVRCSCGTEKLCIGAELRKGKTRSCGCFRDEEVRRRATVHGLSHHKCHHAWSSMIARCTNPKHKAYARYGGRGITVCDRWLASFQNFWNDMGATWREGLTLERLDNNAGYSPTNCAWRGRTAQARNKRNNTEIDTPLG